MGGSHDRPGQDTPFRILVIGDFSGRASRGTAGAAQDLAARRTVRVDRDSLDGAMAKAGIEVHASLGGGDGARVPFRPASLEDFHPDRIYEGSDLFRNLRRVRARLEDPATFEEAAAEIRALAGSAAAAAEPAARPAPPPPTAPAAGPELLGDVLSESERRGVGSSAIPSTPDQWDALIHGLLAPVLARHVVPGADPRKPALQALLDGAASAEMRALLHSREVQAAERAWRSVDFLVKRLETDRLLQVHLLDATRAELAAGLAPGPGGTASVLHKKLVEGTVGTPGGEPWTLIVADATFSPSPADVLLLLRLAKVADGAGAVLLAAAHPSALGCASLFETPDPDDWSLAPASPEGQATWDALRTMPEARRVVLALPRFLLRAPWGAESRRAEAFGFREMPVPPEHGRFLWGNPAFALASLLGQAFSRSGWSMEEIPVGVDGLPAFLYDDDGEETIKACAEVVLSERAGEEILSRGLVPLMSVKGDTEVRLLGLQSFGSPAGSIAGRWKE